MSTWKPSHSRPNIFMSHQVQQTQGRIQRGGMPPNRRLSGFFYGKTGFVGTVLSTRSVLWTSNMPKMRWRPGFGPGPRWAAYDAPWDSLVGEGDTPSPILTTLGAFGASFLAHSALSFCAPNVKSWLRSWANEIQKKRKNTHKMQCNHALCTNLR